METLYTRILLDEIIILRKQKEHAETLAIFFSFAFFAAATLLLVSLFP